MIRNGIKCKPPRYYDKIFGELAPEFMERVKERRKEIALAADEKNRIPHRLEDKEAYKKEVTKKLIRVYEAEN